MTTPPTEPPYGDPNQTPAAAPPTPPQPEPYGQPTAPPYGQPAPTYGQPSYGGPSYGGPGVPAYGTPFVPGAQPPPSKTMAIIALVLSLLFCIPFLTAIASIVLSIVVLRRGKDGRNHGKAMAIAALVIDVLALLGWVAVIVTGVIVGSSYESVDDLRPGQCINASGLDGDGDKVGAISDVSCTSKHDGEVLATTKLSADDADGYDNAAANEVCFAAIMKTDGAADKLTDNPGVTVISLTQSLDPDAGDQIACVASNDDGSKLTGPLE